MKKKKKQSESTGLNHQTWNPCHESLIIKQKKFNIKKLWQKKTKDISFLTVDCTMLFKVKCLKRKGKRKKKQRHTPRVNFFYCIKNIKKMLRYKSVRSFCKDISKSLRSSCNAWSKNTIYNINNNIKLTWLKFRWAWLQHRTLEHWMWIWL